MASLALFWFPCFFFSSLAFAGNTQPSPEEQSQLREKKAQALKEEATQPASNLPSAAGWSILFVGNAMVLGLAALAFWTILFRGSKNGLPLLVLNKPLLMTGAAMVLAWPIIGAGISYKTLPFWSFIGVSVLFVLGWVLMGASLRPRMSYVRGALLGMTTYLIIGIVWGFSFTVFMGEEIRPQVLFGILFSAVFWPMDMAFVLELFGLRPN